MAAVAPLRVPVEIRPAGRAARWFRLAHGVSADGLLLGHPLPDEVEGPVELAFHLPEDPSPVACTGRVVAVAPATGEKEAEPARRGIRFLALDEPTRGRIARYLEERLTE
jgi:hypothetical protein